MPTFAIPCPLCCLLLHSSARSRVAPNPLGSLLALGSPEPLLQCWELHIYFFQVRVSHNTYSHSRSSGRSLTAPPGLLRALAMWIQVEALPPPETRQGCLHRLRPSHAASHEDLPLTLNFFPRARYIQQLRLSIGSAALVFFCAQMSCGQSLLVRGLAVGLCGRTQFTWCIQACRPKKAQETDIAFPIVFLSEYSLE